MYENRPKQLQCFELGISKAGHMFRRHARLRTQDTHRWPQGQVAAAWTGLGCFEASGGVHFAGYKAHVLRFLKAIAHCHMIGLLHPETLFQ